MKQRCGKTMVKGALTLGGLVGAGFLVLLFSACSSLPNLPVPKSENDTLLVFLAGAQKDPNSDYMYFWELKLDEMEKPVTIHPWDKYTIVANLAPGDHKSLTLTFVPHNQSSTWSMSSSAEPIPQKFEIPFTLKPGACTVFPIRLVYKMESDMAMNTGRVGFLPQWLSYADIRAAYEEMKIIKNFKDWKLDETVTNAQ